MDEGVKKPRRSLRPVALASVAFAAVSVISCIITLPLVYHHVQSIQAYMNNEVEFCKVSWNRGISFKM